MKNIKITLPLIISCAVINSSCQTTSAPKDPRKAMAKAAGDVKNHKELLVNHKQLTFSGKRAGEGYFSHDGELMIFQSERESNNPFYQIYVMNMKSQKVNRVSPGFGKTTCSWIFPNKRDVIYASTHADPQSKAIQKAELEDRAAGKQKRYAWDYDSAFDIYRDSISGGRPQNLTRALGYDAEGSVSPDGKWIVFSSNRHAYSSSLPEDQKAQLEKDPSYFLDLYIMDSEGGQVRRLTTAPGYDGGPFFSPDGDSVIFRRFSENGASAEVYTLNLKTNQEKQITHMGAMSWAPMFHPSGDYIVFTSNVYGFDNFELFIVDAEGSQLPIRITELEGFDGLPVFMPNGDQLTWNHKGANGESQIQIADWNDSAVREVLGLPKRFPTIKQLHSQVDAQDAQRIVDYLASPLMKGRATGSAEERIYTQKIAEYFKSLGLNPVNGSYFVEFPFSKTSRLGSENSMVALDGSQKELVIGDDWTPLSFSTSAAGAAAEVVFAGYGIFAPSSADQAEYNSYAGIDVKDKWVMILRYSPEEVDANRKGYLQRYSRLEHKVLLARQRGARGVVFVNGPESKTKNPILRYQQSSSTDAGLLTVSVNNGVVSGWLKKNKQDLSDIQKKLDKGETIEGFTLQGLKLMANVNIVREKGTARNVIGFLRSPGAVKTLVIGAHGDHLGQGPHEGSLMNSKDNSDIHFGADDNASGVAATLELAQLFAEKSKQVPARQNILFAIWSGEELGNLGSNYTVTNLKKMGLSVSAYLNMDMMGRLTDKGVVRPLAVQGVGSSTDWKPLIEGLNKPVGISLSEDPYLPTDAMSFYVGQIPVLSFFSGVHSDYHTPRDTADKLDYVGLANSAQFVGSIAEKLAWDGRIPNYVRIEPSANTNRRGFRIFLGTVPDYATSDIKGVKLSGVIKGGPAEKAGIKGGDIIVKLATYDIQTINDYVYSLESMKPGEETSVIVLRDGKTEELKITPAARE